MSDATIRLTTAQAIVRWLASQFIEIGGTEVRLCGGGFGIFGHGNVTCLGEALYQHREALPLYRGQNEQSMGFAAAGYAKAWLRRRFMFCTASAGPGTSNLVTSAALAHANRLPMLMLCGDTYATRLPDPVLQQMENFGDPTLGVNDAFRPVSRYWDRITHPAQVLQSLPAAVATMLDPGDCGPAFIGLPQDVQGWAYDYPTAFFARQVHRIRRINPDQAEVAEAAALLQAAKRPMIIAGGGVQYSGAVAELTAFAEAHGIPVVETIAGRANLRATHPLNIGPIGVTGSDSANAVAEKADVILAVGTRLQDFTTGSWTAFAREARIIALNAARHDAGKHRAMPIVADARQGIAALGAAMAGHTAPADWLAFARQQRHDWDAYVAENTAPGDNKPNAYAHAIGVVNALCDPRDRIVTASGGLPAEITANWRTLEPGTVDVEFGFSCMGYEIAGGWGHAMAKAGEGTPIVMVGDGSYMLMNSDIYSSVLSGHKMIVVVCDNGGFGVINRLQTNNGIPGFNNLLKDSRVLNRDNPLHVDFVKHAEAMGAYARQCDSLADLEAAMEWAQGTDRTTVLCIASDAHAWTPGGAGWYVGVPEVSSRESVRKARADQVAFRAKQRQGV